MALRCCNRKNLGTFSIGESNKAYGNQDVENADYTEPRGRLMDAI